MSIDCAPGLAGRLDLDSVLTCLHTVVLITTIVQIYLA
jgi:hypothetical protein